LVRGASAILVLYVFDDAASLDFAMARLRRARRDCCDTAAVALVGTAYTPGKEAYAFDSDAKLSVRAVKCAFDCNARHFHVVASDRVQVDALFADVVGEAAAKREASERAFAEKRAQDAELAASSNDTAADLEVVCYFLALLFLLLGSV